MLLPTLLLPLLQNGFWVGRNDWKAWHMPHILLCTEVAQAFSDARQIKYRVQRPYQNARCVLACRYGVAGVPQKLCVLGTT